MAHALRYQGLARPLTRQLHLTKCNGASLHPGPFSDETHAESSEPNDYHLKHLKIREPILVHENSRIMPTSKVDWRFRAAPPPLPVWDGHHLQSVHRDTGVKTKISNVWLRDQCPCEACVHPLTKQRQIDTFQIDPEIQIKNCHININTNSNKPSADVEWEDGHKSVYDLASIQHRGSHNDMAVVRGLVRPWLWGSNMRTDYPTAQYKAVRAKGVSYLTSKIRSHGFCFVSNTPKTPEATQELLEMIGPIRNTHYGGFYDFTSDMASKDTAYTDLALEAHTDTTYFTEPAGLQMFHMLSHTDGEGGKSLLVDGFSAAKQLFEEDPQAYRTLSTVGVLSHASGNEDVSIQPYRSFPVLQHDLEHGHLVQVRWNNSDRAAVMTGYAHTDSWYNAARKFNKIVNDHRNQYWFQLQPGMPVIFDNWRVLHGRSKFTGKRRMCGGYVSRDDFISKYKLTNIGRERVVAAAVTG